MNSFIVGLIFVLVFSGCSRKAPTHAQFNMTTAVMGSNLLEGGVYLYAYKKEGRHEELTTYDLPTNHQIEMPSGNYNLYFVGYRGPMPWMGERFCGSLENARLEGAQATFDIELKRSYCEADLFIVMNDDKNPIPSGSMSLWNEVQWNEANWE